MRLTHLTLAIATIFSDHAVASSSCTSNTVTLTLPGTSTETFTTYSFTSWYTPLPKTIYETVSCDSIISFAVASSSCTSDTVTLTLPGTSTLTETFTSYDFTSWYTQLPKTIYETVSCNSSISSVVSGTSDSSSSSSTQTILSSSSVFSTTSLYTSSTLLSTSQSSESSTLGSYSSSSALDIGSSSSFGSTPLNSGSSLPTSAPPTPTSDGAHTTPTQAASNNPDTASIKDTGSPTQDTVPTPSSPSENKSPKDPVEDGGFELSGLASPWDFGALAGFLIGLFTPGLFGSGQAFQFVRPANSNAAPVLLSQTMSNLCVGSMYAVTASLDLTYTTSSDMTFGLLVTASDPSGSSLTIATLKSPQAGLITISGSFTVPASTIKLEFTFLGNNAYTVLLDNVAFDLLNPSASVSCPSSSSSYLPPSSISTLMLTSSIPQYTTSSMGQSSSVSSNLISSSTLQSSTELSSISSTVSTVSSPSSFSSNTVLSSLSSSTSPRSSVSSTLFSSPSRSSSHNIILTNSVASSTSTQLSSTISSTTLSSTISTSCAVPTPLLNGGFDSGLLSPWITAGNAPGWSINVVTPGLNATTNAIQAITPSESQGGLCLILQQISNLCVGSLYTVAVSYQVDSADPANELVLRTLAPDQSHLLDLYDVLNPPAGVWIHVAKTFTPTLETMQLGLIFLSPNSKSFLVDDIQFTLGDSTASYTSVWNAFPTRTATSYTTMTGAPAIVQATTAPSTTSASTIACNTAPVVVTNGGFESGTVTPWIVRGDDLRCACNAISPGYQSSGALSCYIPAGSMPSSGYTILDQVIPNACAGVNYTISAQVKTNVYNAQFSEIVMQVWDTGYLHYSIPFDTMLPPSAVNTWFSLSGTFISSGNGLILRFIMLADAVDTYYTIDNIVLSVTGSTPPPVSSVSSTLSTILATSSSKIPTSSSSSTSIKSSTTSTTASPTPTATQPPWPPIPGVCPIQFFQVATFELTTSPYAFSDPSAISVNYLNPTSDPQNSWAIVSPGFLSEYAFAAYNVRSQSGSPYSGTTLATEIDTCPGVSYTISVNFKFLSQRPNTYINIFVDGMYVISDRADGTAVSSYPVPANEPGWYFAKGSFTATRWQTDLVISFLCTAGDTETILFDNLVIEPLVPPPW